MFKEINEDVLIASESIVKIDTHVVNLLRNRAKNSLRGRARICAHKNAEDSIHEMIIAIESTSYIRPHRHINKTESFHLIDGAADIVVFKDNGDINEVVELDQNRNFFYRIDEPFYHTLLIKTPFLIIHETTNGPFVSELTEFAKFSPKENSPYVNIYCDKLKKAIDLWKANFVLKEI